jgi:hypothetical protein
MSAGIFNNQKTTKLDMYNAVKDRMKTGDILLWQSDSLLGSAIRWRTKSDVNHASMIIRMSEWEGLERRRFHTEAMERGVYPNLLSNRLEGCKGKVWWLPLKDSWDNKRQLIGERLTDCWGKKYDYKSLLWQAIGKVSIDTQQLFCSEVIDYALGFTGQAHNPGELEGLGINSDKILIYESS